jgi:hypothetical protein
MNFTIFEQECVGIALRDWPFPLVGIYSAVDPGWAMLRPIPEENPLSKAWKSIDSDFYFKLEDIKLIKHIKYAEKNKNTTTGGFGPETDRDTGKTAIG